MATPSLVERFNGAPPRLTTSEVLDAYGRRGATAEPKVGEEDIGRLSAEAVLAQYELAAKAVEDMGEAIKTRVARLADALAEADADMRLVAETAKAIREKGALAHAQIEEAAGVSKEIRGACADFRSKIAGDQ